MKPRQKDTPPPESTPQQPPEQQSPEQQLAPERWTVDGLEDTPHGKVARVELPDGRTADIPLSDLPSGVREGDILDVQGGPDGLRTRILLQETERRQQAAQNRLQALNDAGDSAGQEITL